MAKPTHLYCVSGEKSLQMKTTEVWIAMIAIVGVVACVYVFCSDSTTVLQSLYLSFLLAQD